jgi:hypothetical protein
MSRRALLRLDIQVNSSYGRSLDASHAVEIARWGHSLHYMHLPNLPDLLSGKTIGSIY